MTKIYKPPNFDNQIVVPKEIFGHSLSMSSVGFYCWLFTQKANVPITFDVIKKTFNVSNHTIRKQIKELEKDRDKLISKLNSKDENEVVKKIFKFCEIYEKLCEKKYPEAPLPLEILNSKN